MMLKVVLDMLILDFNLWFSSVDTMMDSQIQCTEHNPHNKKTCGAKYANDFEMFYLGKKF